jgi:hypothetical protein
MARSTAQQRLRMADHRDTDRSAGGQADGELKPAGRAGHESLQRAERGHGFIPVTEENPGAGAYGFWL